MSFFLPYPDALDASAVKLSNQSESLRLSDTWHVGEHHQSSRHKGRHKRQREPPHHEGHCLGILARAAQLAHAPKDVALRAAAAQGAAAPFQAQQTARARVVIIAAVVGTTATTAATTASTAITATKLLSVAVSGFVCSVPALVPAGAAVGTRTSVASARVEVSDEGVRRAIYPKAL